MTLNCACNCGGVSLTPCFFCNTVLPVKKQVLFISKLILFVGKFV